MLHECFSLIVASPAPLQGFNSAACTIELFPFFAPSSFPRIFTRWTRIPSTCVLWSTCVPNTVRLYVGIITFNCWYLVKVQFCMG